VPSTLAASILKKYKHTFPARSVLKIIEARGDKCIRGFQEYLVGKKVLDLGVGIGIISHKLRALGYDVTGLDVADTCIYSDSSPQIYDGVQIPYPNKYFDETILLYVLHHCANKFEVLDEALRVSKRVIVFEDSYRNWLEHGLVAITDCIGNGEFYYHPIYTSNWWKEYISSKGYRLVDLKEWQSLDYGILYGYDISFVIESNT
jgi:SAM-dependent methyltransferase